MVGPPKWHLLPLLLLSVAALFFYSYYHSTLHPFPTNLNPNFPLRTHTPPPDFTFIVKVLAYNRLDSLARCLRSLAAADYLSDRVHLHIYVDHFAVVNGSGADLDRGLEESGRLLEFADGFDWKFGEKLVHYRTQNAGLQAQWLEAWWPGSDDEFAFVVEDDLEVSPLYYRFLRSLIVNYYYGDPDFRPYIYGVSLQRPRFVPGKHGNKIQLDSGTRLFLYQLVGTWGQLLFPKPWKEFRLWYDKHKAKGIKPYLDGMVTNGWYKKMGERIWTPWFIKFIHFRGYYNFYTNFLHERALSVSHRDVGVNYGKSAGPDSNLLDENSLDFNLLEMQPLSNLKWYDFCFREVIPERVVRRFDDLGSVLHSVQQQETAILVSLYGAPEIIIRNLLCSFEKLNVRNFIFVGPESDFLLDLARRGHPVIVGDQFLRSVTTYKMTDPQDSHAELISSILVKSYVIKKNMELGYSSLVMEGNMLLVKGYPYLDFDNIHDFYTGKSSGLFFVRNSTSARKIWVDKFIPASVVMLKSLLGKQESTSFAGIMGKLLEEKNTKIKIIDETRFGVDISSNNVNQFSLGVERKIIYWPAGMGLDLLRKRLEEFGVWMVDDDFSCKAVVCHQS
ncbi:Nucleotide-diphospho-sugar transferase [Parasponia andersonii]|uniref:Nucleotide-diphospho-sugar transferase n=1 Tax=Parasponia andersonii TaxID=3476 RepID=A0A2P5DLG0_PARAD|nr:Nucleotide-diphospho-sugar transferase [Parasponia andersonii]